ncbi:hypothetical protein [Terrilactibacillus laevilacticus]|uniref:SCP domain-containing protein n=1 Tax=Terrilactibacillus laevilacticus TaxID=1380157 RepID=A0ABW5PQ58_9BACI|nr:hypothetical protein [Terrilactibacillus laevilacticus]
MNVKSFVYHFSLISLALMLLITSYFMTGHTLNKSQLSVAAIGESKNEKQLQSMEVSHLSPLKPEEKEMFLKINKARKLKHMPLLQMDFDLARLARLRAEQIKLGKTIQPIQSEWIITHTPHKRVFELTKKESLSETTNRLYHSWILKKDGYFLKHNIKGTVGIGYAADRNTNQTTWVIVMIEK